MSRSPTLSPRAHHEHLTAALVRLEGALRRNQAAQRSLADHAHLCAQDANLSRAALLDHLEGGDVELSAQDLAHGLTDREQRLRTVGVLLDGSARDPDQEEDALDLV